MMVTGRRRDCSWDELVVTEMMAEVVSQMASLGSAMLTVNLAKLGVPWNTPCS